MKSTILLLTVFFFSFPITAQTLFDEVTFWVGQGQDSAVFIVDFNDNSDFESYAWGVLFNGTIDGVSMLQQIAAADPGFQFAENNGFLNDIIYRQQQGLGGQPDYWSTWNGSTMTNLSTNLGLSTVIGPSELFACSYTDFNPATYPDTPIAATNPAAFTFEDIPIWNGSGADSTVLVIDFNDGQVVESYAWGYLFNGSLTGEDLIEAIAAIDPGLDIAISNGFLSDITYKTKAGIGGQPDYWSTWNGTDIANWTSNLGLTTAVLPGELFGCSYTDFNPAIPPSPPVAADLATDINQPKWTVNLYPNPAQHSITVDINNSIDGSYSIFSLHGQLVQSGTWRGQQPISLAPLATATYILQLYSREGTFQSQITKLAP